MQATINNLHISNYKSVKELDLHGCKRINVFVGEPNTGKSNILEALDLSYLSWMMGMNQSNEKADKELIDLKHFYRINKVENLFHEGNIRKPIIVNSSDVSWCNISLEYKNEKIRNKSFFSWKGGGITDFDNDFNLIDEQQSSYASPIAPFAIKQICSFTILVIM